MTRDELVRVKNKPSILLSIMVDYSCMAISIKSIETEHLAREIAAKTGESLTRAIQKALEERLERLEDTHRNQVLATQLDDILRRVDQMPNLDSRSPDEIIGYDEDGLPR
jgi:antitoxin VapB